MRSLLAAALLGSAAAIGNGLIGIDLGNEFMKVRARAAARARRRPPRTGLEASSAPAGGTVDRERQT
jgi:hypothetical protein